jgi:hypothetical protein
LSFPVGELQVKTKKGNELFIPETLWESPMGLKRGLFQPSRGFPISKVKDAAFSHHPFVLLGSLWNPKSS